MAKISWRFRGCFNRIACFGNSCFPHMEVEHETKSQRGPFDVRGNRYRVRGLRGLRRLTWRPDPVGEGPAQKRAKGGRMLLRLIKVALLTGLVALVVQSLPDIRRYLKMRRM